MNDIRIKGDILIVSAGEKGRHNIAGLIDRRLYSSLLFSGTGGDTRRLLKERKFQLVVINTPLSDEFGHELASEIAHHYSCGVILLVNSDVYNEVCGMVQDDGVITVPKPVSRQYFHQALRLGAVIAARLSAWEEERARLNRRLEEARLTGRAKCLLVEQRGLSETEAHHYLEKEAMDRRMSLRDVCREIIRMYE